MKISKEILTIYKKIKNQLESSEGSVVDTIQALADQPMSIEILEDTKIGLKINKLKKSCVDETVRKELKSLIKKWKQLVPSQKSKTEPEREVNGEIIFPGFPEFRPNLTPREIFQLGSFGGTYWRPIKSEVTNQCYKDVHKNYPEEWWQGIPEKNLTLPFHAYNVNLNKYKEKVGTTLEYWEEKTWISKYHPYGWVHWYCDFYSGKRCPDDRRQIDRWVKTAGPNSRFRRALINLILKQGKKFNDFRVSPKRRQTLQHWAYMLKEEDCV